MYTLLLCRGRTVPSLPTWWLPSGAFRGRDERRSIQDNSQIGLRRLFYRLACQRPVVSPHHHTLTYTYDTRSHRYVALKILIADSEAQDRELRTLKSLQNLSASAGLQHILRLLDDFRHTGPNGVHSCLVLELLGPSIPSVIAAHFHDGRLPGIISKRVATQVVLGISFLHRNGIGHGGIKYLPRGVLIYLLRKKSRCRESADTV